MPATKNAKVTLHEPCVQKNFFLTTDLTLVSSLTGSSGWSCPVMCSVCGKEMPLVWPIFCVK